MLCALLALLAADPLDGYNVRWNSPTSQAQAAAGSMPIGNGTVGLNVWVEEGGDLLLLLSRTDAWSECDRLLKLGRVRLSMSPNPFAAGSPFSQELILREGRIRITAGPPGSAADFSVYVLPDAPEVRIDASFDQPTSLTAAFETWRTERRFLSDTAELISSWTMRDAPAEVRRDVWESADVVRTVGDAIVWHHRNEHSVVPFTLRHQGLEAIADQFPDALLHRTFGGRMFGRGLSPTGTGTLSTPAPLTDVSLRIVTHSAQTQTLDRWDTQLERLAGSGPDPASARARTAEWWGRFWERSFIFVEGDRPERASVPVNKHPLRIGADSNNANRFRGFMLWPAVYAAPLSSEDIRNLAGDRSIVNPPAGVPHPVAAWGHEAEDGTIKPIHGTAPLTAVGDAAAAFWAPDGEALAFRGGHFSLAHDAAPDFSNGFTLTANIMADAAIPQRIFDKKTAGSADGFILDTHPGDALRLIVGHTTISAPGVLVPGRWQFIAATFDPATGCATLFVDGKPVARTPMSDPAPPSRVTQAYVLQRWISACGSRVPRSMSDDPGESARVRAWPIKFNGSIFTVEPRHTEGQPFNADWRKWGGCFWWQNTRLPYYPMLAAGDFDCMEPLFAFYESVLPGCRARTAMYYGASGVYFPETITSFGGYANGDYGWNRDGLAVGDISPCPWWQWAWNQSLELSQLMLDYGAYTGDDRFLRERALPMARETLRYFDSRFKRDEKSTLIISPTQAVETYWHDVVNDAPTVAGLHAVCDLLLALPATIGSEEDRALWRRVKAATPALPVTMIDGESLPLPAESYRNQRSNVETPELYPLWPFRQYGLGKPGLEGARRAFQARRDRSTVGWTQDGLFAAMLGLTEEARDNLLAKTRNTHRAFRFPAMWGPNFDWLPDQCHGGNLMSGLQLMLMQCDGDTIRLLPAWPRAWNATFKLHAPHRTMLEGRVENGTITRLTITPEHRRKDIIIHEPAP